MPGLSHACERTLRRALAYAGSEGQSEATPEHLLLGLLIDPDAADVLRSCGVDLTPLRAALTPAAAMLVPPPAGAVTDEVKRIVQRAAPPVRVVSQEGVTGARLLEAMFGATDTRAVAVLGIRCGTRSDR